MATKRHVTVHLYGQLGKRFGKRFKLYVSSVADAVNLLEANFHGRFHHHLREGAYLIRRGESPSKTGSHLIYANMICAGLDEGDIHIIPAVHGASKGLAGLILGTLLIGAAIVFSGGAAAFAAGGGITALTGSLGAGLVSWSTVASIGLGLAITGIAQMMAPHPSTDSPMQQEGGATNNLFSGPVNVNKAGGCMPVLYGRALTGSVVASAGIHSETVDIPRTSSMDDYINAGASPILIAAMVQLGVIK